MRNGFEHRLWGWKVVKIGEGEGDDGDSETRVAGGGEDAKELGGYEMVERVEENVEREGVDGDEEEGGEERNWQIPETVLLTRESTSPSPF